VDDAGRQTDVATLLCTPLADGYGAMLSALSRVKADLQRQAREGSMAMLSLDRDLTALAHRVRTCAEDTEVGTRRTRTHATAGPRRAPGFRVVMPGRVPIIMYVIRGPNTLVRMSSSSREPRKPGAGGGDLPRCRHAAGFAQVLRTATSE